MGIYRLMSFISDKNKFSSEFKNSQANNSLIDDLSIIKIISNNTNFVNKQREIILTDKQYCTGTSWRGNYQFDNLDNRNLIFLKP